LTIILIITSLSLGLLTAIIRVSATSALSAILFVPFLAYNSAFFCRNQRKRDAAIRLLPSIKEWFLTTKYKRWAAFSSTLG